jgi:hypothetical protein
LDRLLERVLKQLSYLPKRVASLGRLLGYTSEQGL